MIWYRPTFTEDDEREKVEPLSQVTSFEADDLEGNRDGDVQDDLQSRSHKQDDVGLTVISEVKGSRDRGVDERGPDMDADDAYHWLPSSLVVPDVPEDAGILDCQGKSR